MTQSSALAAQLTGTFRLRLELGSYASSGTDISVAQGNFGLVVPVNQATLVLLKFTTMPAPPYHLDPGGKLDLVFTVADKPETVRQILTKEEQNALCAARTAVEVSGSISESASGVIPITSGPFAVSGCP